jgi:polyisoprenoid-binding protein YceI
MIRHVPAIALLSAAGATHAAEWSLVAEASTLGFASSYDGEAFDGRFQRFTPAITLDPASPEATRIEVSIDIASVSTENEERDGTLATPEFFWTGKFPSATFRTTACKAGAAPGAIDCEAALMIRDRTVAMPFNLRFEATGDRATLKAQARVDRIAFEIGSGEWADTALIPQFVDVTVDLVLARKQAPGMHGP